MLKLKKMLSLFIVSLLMVSFTACSAPKEAPVNETPKQVLNVGAISSIEAVPIIMAAEKGFFEKEGLTVNFQPFKSSKDRDAAFQAGTLDGIICDVVAICLYQNADFDVKVTGSTDGDFMLIANANAGIQSINDVKGKSVAISEKTCIEYTLDKLLEKNGMTPQEVQKTVIPPVPTRLEMLLNNKVDMALLPEPFSTLALKNGAILLDSGNQKNIFPSITAFKQEAIDSKANEIQAFYKAYNQAVDYINSTPIAEYEDLIIKTVGYPEDMRGKITLPTFRHNALPSEQEMQSAIDWTSKNGLLNKSLTPKDVMNNIGVQ